MHILGISCFYHDAAAALVRDGQLIAAAEEERFSRRKHDFGWPAGAIAYCLREAGITINDVDHVVFYEKPILKFERILSCYISTWPMSYIAFAKALPLWLKDRLWLKDHIQKQLGTDHEILFAEHHMSHAASAFLVSPFEEATVLTLDGVGEWTTTTMGWGRGSEIQLTREIRFPHSLGLFYSAITAYLGFEVNDAEWKVMGLAPYGKSTLVEPCRQLIRTQPDGSFALNMRYFAHHYSAQRMFNRRFEQLFGQPQRVPEAEIGEFHQDIARSGQHVFEEVAVNLARAAHELHPSDNLCLAGGCALNTVANWKIMEQTPFKRLFVQPAAGDSGGAVGAAFYIYNTVLGNPREFTLRDVYLGPAFDEAEMETALRAAGTQVRWEKLPRVELLQRTAAVLRDDKVIGWFQGRMEFGPRALGCRSILANPMNPEMKKIVNSKIKFREYFRPFAPAVLRERADEFFEMNGQESPFMLLVPPVRADKRAVIPAVTHADGTGRVQTVVRETNEKFYELIQQFAGLTGVPVLLNTSFNVRGEPIVCTPQDAVNCFLKTGLDYLVLGNILIRKP
jgi:carbamoyltransferase